MTKIQLLWFLLGASWAGVEVFIALHTRVEFNALNKLEYRSERLIWLVVAAALLASLGVKQLHWSPLPIAYMDRQIGAVLIFIAGLALRCYAVFSLGEFFSTTVVTQEQHVIIENGPYAVIRHPAYAGLICSFFAAGVAMGDGLALMVLLCPIFYVFIVRMRLEEQWLYNHFGAPYLDYCQRTKKILPWIF